MLVAFLKQFRAFKSCGEKPSSKGTVYFRKKLWRRVDEEVKQKFGMTKG